MTLAKFELNMSSVNDRITLAGDDGKRVADLMCAKGGAVVNEERGL